MREQDTPAGEAQARSNDSIAKTLVVALTLCIVCSLVVSTAAVALRPLQQANKALDKKRNILLAAGLYDEHTDLETLFARVKPRLVDLRTGHFVPGVDALQYDQRAAARDPARSTRLPAEQDPARIRRRADYATVYLVESEGRLEAVILPVYGAGLYSTLYGFVALEADGRTIRGVRFYEHGETPGLGGEVDNVRWLAKWSGKRVYDEEGRVRLAVIKGSVDPAQRDAAYQVDGISGATLTSRGVSELMRFWLGEQGFRPFLASIRSGGL